MNLEHKEKQAIFDSYAKEQGYDEWESLLYDIINDESIYRADAITEHVMKVTDLIQRKALERASDSGCNSLELYNSEYATLEKSITNEKNIIK